MYFMLTVCGRPQGRELKRFPYGRRRWLVNTIIVGGLPLTGSLCRDGECVRFMVSTVWEGVLPFTSGVQRLLDARGQRGSWMPSKIFSIRPDKFLTTFLSVVKFITIRSLDDPSRAASCPGNDIFLFIFFAIYLHFFTKNDPLDAPQGGCPGPSHRPHPL